MSNIVSLDSVRPQKWETNRPSLLRAVYAVIPDEWAVLPDGRAIGPAIAAEAAHQYRTRGEGRP